MTTSGPSGAAVGAATSLTADSKLSGTPPRKENSMKIVAFLMLMTAVTCAQTPASHPVKSDAEKVASAMQGGPKFGGQNATVLDWPSSPGGESRVLRAGTNGWTCLPGRLGAAHDEPGCFDQVFLQFMKASMAGGTPNGQSAGIYTFNC